LQFYPNKEDAAMAATELGKTNRPSQVQVETIDGRIERGSAYGIKQTPMK
jgi:hypothetical protein